MSVNKVPYLMDDLDRRLVSALRKDGRASIAQLANDLKVARGTVQSRLDRLLSSGAILGFTIRAHQELEENLIKAIMMIEVAGKSTRQVISHLHGIPQLTKLHTTNGSWDLMAHLETTSLAEFDQVLGTVRMIDGVLNSETSIVLTTV